MDDGNSEKEYPTRGKQIHDANIVATMLVNGVDTLLTMNVADLQRYQGRITLVPLYADVMYAKKYCLGYSIKTVYLRLETCSF